MIARVPYLASHHSSAPSPRWFAVPMQALVAPAAPLTAHAGHRSDLDATSTGYVSKPGFTFQIRSWNQRLQCQAILRTANVGNPVLDEGGLAGPQRAGLKDFPCERA